MNWLASGCARLTVGFVLFFIFLTSVFIAGVAFHDPDTCWLLALGRYIFTHHGLPQTDPYSFTFALLHGKPFVMYQWLTELLFYLAYKICGLSAVLALTALVLVNAFISVPLSICMRIATPRLWAVFVVVLSVLSASWHFLVRPEIFSYLLMSIWLGLILILQEDARRAMDDPINGAHGTGHSPGSAGVPPASHSRINRTVIVAMAALMVLWSNLHSGFVLGLVVLAIYIVSAVIGWLAFTRTSKFRIQEALLALVLSSLATLLNPRGIGLWLYLPQLFFSGINKNIVELRPLSWSDPSKSVFYPFVLLCLIGIGMTIYAWISVYKTLQESGQERKNVKSVFAIYGVFATALIITATISGFYCRRIIPFDAIGLAIASSSLWKVFGAIQAGRASQINEGNTVHKSSLFSFLRLVESHMQKMFQPQGVWWYLLVATLTLLGVYLTTSRIAPPTLPSSSLVFPAPFSAIEYLRKHPPVGRVFSNPQYGDMMIWHLKPVPPLFIDTRFDMYGPELIADFEIISECRSNWRQVFDKYDFAWAFVRSRSQLSQRLIKDLNWKEIYTDQNAVILQRQGMH
jgi:hypothetical protein